LLIENTLISLSINWLIRQSSQCVKKAKNDPFSVYKAYKQRGFLALETLEMVQIRLVEVRFFFMDSIN
jgi:hypothetical protein